jgi:hypothetical protein
MELKKSMLFIRGFDTTVSVGADEYLYLKLLFEKTYEFTYFDYEPNEDLKDVYARFLSTIEKKKFDIFIGHNLGGGLLVKYIKSAQYKNEKVILLMPFICRNPNLDLVSNFFTFHKRFDPKLVFSKAIFSPLFYILEGSIVLNSDFSLVSFKQLYDMYMDPDIQTNDISKFMNDNANVTIFYAEDERLNIIDETILRQIPKGRLIRVNGFHECWRSSSDPDTDLFARLNNRLNTKVKLCDVVFQVMKRHNVGQNM